jgi:hypothetical protein
MPAIIIPSDWMKVAVKFETEQSPQSRLRLADEAQLVNPFQLEASLLKLVQDRSKKKRPDWKS